MPKELRFRCPFCGLLVLQRDLEKEIPLEVWVKSFGGRYPHSKRGIMEWRRIESPEIEGAYRLKVLERIRQVAGWLGYNLERVGRYFILEGQPLRISEYESKGAEVEFQWLRK
jgi:hypothetical protein